MNSGPKISIVTPSFNQGAYLENTIVSVLGQNYPDIEYVIIDGGSSDNSIEIIRNYESSLAFWVSEPDNGQAHAINKGLGRVTGDLVAWIASDDWYEPGTFNLVAESFRGGHNLIIGDCMRFYTESGKQRLLTPGRPSFNSMLRYWRKGFCPPQPSIFFSAELLRKVGPIDESLNFAMDLDLWLRMSRYEQFYYIPQVFSNYLVHKESKSGSGGGFDKFRKEWFEVCRRHLLSASRLEKLAFYIDHAYYSVRAPHRLRTD